MKNKALFIVASSLLLGTIVTVGVLSGTRSISSIGLFGVDGNKTLTLDESNSPLTSTDTSYGEKYQNISGVGQSIVRLHYESVKYASGSHVRLETNSAIYPVSLLDDSVRERSNGLTRITVSYSDAASIVIRSSYELVDNAITGNASYFNIYAESGTEYEVRGNYWEIIALSGSGTINSITVNYNCSEASSSLSTESVGVASFEASKTFVSLSEENDSIYYRIKGSYSGGEFDPARVKIEDDDDGGNKRPIAVSRIEYRQNSTFVFWFNLTENKETLMENSHNVYLPHLYINEQKWSSDTSDVKQDEYRPDAASKFLGGYYYNIYCEPYVEEGNVGTYGMVAFNINPGASLYRSNIKGYNGNLEGVESTVSRARQSSSDPWADFYLRFFLGSQTITPKTDDFVLYQDGKTYPVTPRKAGSGDALEYWNKAGNGGTTIHLWFNLDDFSDGFADDIGGDGNRYYFPHLFYKGYPVDGGGNNSDLKVEEIKQNEGNKNRSDCGDEWTKVWGVGDYEVGYRWKQLAIKNNSK